ncbi:AAA family ATPase [Jiangella alba]|uniref:Predicted kinase n=1 Tax=Jiangella alba TaxID=561176 RepID=A0A1H5PWP6_9ACTN|nr:AAA family ATPase [Jiangella alba]SEF17618.1 Predicted kinase [Jiangella alba]
MADYLVLVNGLPGAGKTTLATQLAPALTAPLLSKDAIKEALADVVGAAPASALGPVAMEAAWSIAAALPGLVVVESWWFRPRDLGYVRTGLGRCAANAMVEVWCDVPPDIARRRYAARRRHPVHDDQQRLEHAWDEWAARAEPLGVGPTVRVDTTGRVDVEEVARLVQRTLGQA